MIAPTIIIEYVPMKIKIDKMRGRDEKFVITHAPDKVKIYWVLYIDCPCNIQTRFSSSSK
jgi:hypothetical protein